MKAMLVSMKKKKNNIPESYLPFFEDIKSDTEFLTAMEKHLTKEQRFTIWAENGACRGMKHDKVRKSFAAEHSNESIREKFDAFINSVGCYYNSPPNSVVLDEENNTITVGFTCKHGLQHLEKGISTSLEAYFGYCAGGRLYEFQLALGVKLKIKDVDVSAVKEDIKNPCMFTFEIVQ